MAKRDTSVKWLTSQMVGAPAITMASSTAATAGTLLNVLDACLIDGFGLKPVTSISVSGEIATVTVSTGSPILQDAVALISGVTGALSALNGEWRADTANATTFTFYCPGVPDGAAAGSISVKVAPLGWEKAFSDVPNSVAVYRSADLLSSRALFRVSDPAGYVARVVGYEAMTDVNTGTFRFPTDAQVAGGLYVPKASNSGTTTNRKWAIVGDGRFFFLLPCHNTSYPNWAHIAFLGDYTPLYSSDVYPACIAAADSDRSQSNNSSLFGLEYICSMGPPMYCPRTLAGAQVSTKVGSIGYPSSQSNSTTTSGSVLWPTLSSLGGVMTFIGPASHSATSAEKYAPRGFLGGALYGMADASASHPSLTSNRYDIGGKQKPIFCIQTSTSPGFCFFDLEGPWR